MPANLDPGTRAEIEGYLAELSPRIWELARVALCDAAEPPLDPLPAEPGGWSLLADPRRLLGDVPA